MQAQDEVIELLEDYCKWCNAQGGQCQLSLDGCAVGEALAKLKEEPEQSNLLVKKCRTLIRKGVTDEQWELSSLLLETCEVIDQLQAEIKKLIEGQQAKKEAGN